MGKSKSSRTLLASSSRRGTRTIHRVKYAKAPPTATRIAQPTSCLLSR